MPQAEHRHAQALPVAPGPVGVAAVSAALRRRFQGGPAFAPVPAGVDPAAVASLDLATPVAPETAVILLTGGSTGRRRGVEISAAALQGAAAAARAALGGGGRWACALPVVHVGGLMVVVRALLDGDEPLATGSGRFDAVTMAALAAGLQRAAGDGPVRVSLVPEQLRRLLDAGHGAALGACDAVLIGGGPVPASLRSAARDAGVAIRATYGMTETCGGIVWDGVALPGFRVRTDGGPTGQVWVSGPSLATCYRDPSRPGERLPLPMTDGWLRTSDLGRLAGDRLEILGRLDDTVKVDGVLVSPAAVSAILTRQPGVADAHAYLDAHDPQRPVIGALLVAATPIGDRGLAERTLQEAVCTDLGRPAMPRRLTWVAAIPRDAAGKPLPAAGPPAAAGVR